VIDGYRSCAILILYDESLELNPEKPKEVKQEQRIIYLSNGLLELNPEKI
jgi:hypothetical protein